MRSMMCAVIVISFMVIGCGKSVEDLHVSDLVGVDSVEAWRVLEKADMVQSNSYRDALKRLRDHDSLSQALGWTIAQLDSNQRAWNRFAEPRMQIYKLVVVAVKDWLKVPSTAQLGSFTGLDNDSVRLIYSGPDTVKVEGKYNAQNGFGVFLPGEYTAHLVRKNQNWTWMWGGDTPRRYLDIVVY